MQTTDKKVNEITPDLFKHAPDAAALAQADVEHVQIIIRQIGLAPTKAKNIVATAEMLVEQHGGDVPKTFEELEALPGVGHKTASVVMSQCHGCSPLCLNVSTGLLSCGAVVRMHAPATVTGCVHV